MMMMMMMMMTMIHDDDDDDAIPTLPLAHRAALVHQSSARARRLHRAGSRRGALLR